jgi:hypothetical protein
LNLPAREHLDAADTGRARDNNSPRARPALLIFSCQARREPREMAGSGAAEAATAALEAGELVLRLLMAGGAGGPAAAANGAAAADGAAAAAAAADFEAGPSDLEEGELEGSEPSPGSASDDDAAAGSLLMSLAAGAPALAPAAPPPLPRRATRNYWQPYPPLAPGEQPGGDGQAFLLAISKANFPPRMILPSRVPRYMAAHLFGAAEMAAVAALDDALPSKGADFVFVDETALPDDYKMAGDAGGADGGGEPAAGGAAAEAPAAGGAAVEAPAAVAAAPASDAPAGDAGGADSGRERAAGGAAAEAPAAAAAAPPPAPPPPAGGAKPEAPAGPAPAGPAPAGPAPALGAPPTPPRPVEESIRLVIYHRTSGSPQYLSRLGAFFQRHALDIGDMLLLTPAGPGRARVRVWKAAEARAVAARARIGFIDAEERGLMEARAIMKAGGGGGTGRRGRGPARRPPGAPPPTTKRARGAAPAAEGEAAAAATAAEKQAAEARAVDALLCAIGARAAAAAPPPPLRAPEQPLALPRPPAASSAAPSAAQQRQFQGAIAQLAQAQMANAFATYINSEVAAEAQRRGLAAPLAPATRAALEAEARAALNRQPPPVRTALITQRWGAMQAAAARAGSHAGAPQPAMQAGVPAAGAAGAPRAPSGPAPFLPSAMQLTAMLEMFASGPPPAVPPSAPGGAPVVGGGGRPMQVRSTPLGAAPAPAPLPSPPGPVSGTLVRLAREAQDALRALAGAPGCSDQQRAASAAEVRQAVGLLEAAARRLGSAAPPAAPH